MNPRVSEGIDRWPSIGLCLGGFTGESRYLVTFSEQSGGDSYRKFRKVWAHERRRAWRKSLHRCVYLSEAVLILIEYYLWIWNSCSNSNFLFLKFMQQRAKRLIDRVIAVQVRYPPCPLDQHSIVVVQLAMLTFAQSGLWGSHASVTGVHGWYGLTASDLLPKSPSSGWSPS